MCAQKERANTKSTSRNGLLIIERERFSLPVCNNYGMKMTMRNRPRQMKHNETGKLT